jgi:hypothetical protein
MCESSNTLTLEWKDGVDETGVEFETFARLNKYSMVSC